MERFLNFKGDGHFQGSAKKMSFDAARFTPDVSVFLRASSIDPNNSVVHFPRRS